LKKRGRDYFIFVKRQISEKPIKSRKIKKIENMFSGKCDWCGIKLDIKDSIQVGGSYWWSTSGKHFCSKKCVKEAEKAENH